MEKYTLKEHLELLKGAGLIDSLPQGEFLDRTVELVSCDSQEVTDGTLFIVKGAHFKEQYLKDAKERGAFFYLAERPFENVDLPYIILKDLRRAMSLLASFYYNEPWKDLKIIATTATKGKSTTSYFIKAIMDEYARANGKKDCGLVSTIDVYDGTGTTEAHQTTPEPLMLEKILSNAKNSGLEYMSLEVSSQALKYDRVEDIRFDIGCFLNIGYDHISPKEHTDWEDYFTSKLHIFDLCRIAVINLDSDNADRILSAAKNSKNVEKIITFSQKNTEADVFGYNVHKANGRTVFNVRTKKFDSEFSLLIPGLFNVENALAAIAACSEAGAGETALKNGLAETTVSGRMEPYTSKDGLVTVIVDYAHNALSFTKLFESVKEEFPGARLIPIFGCPGKKAFNRRHDMGDIAGKYADFVYITQEDPGEEDPYEIAKEIAKAIEPYGCPYTVEIDRGLAIAKAVSEAKEKTVILVTGKGNEKWERRGTVYVEIPSNAEYAMAALKEYDAAHPVK